MLPVCAQAIFVPCSCTNTKRMLGTVFSIVCELVKHRMRNIKGINKQILLQNQNVAQIPLFILDYINDKVVWCISCCFVLPTLDSCSFGVLFLFFSLVCDDFKTWHLIRFKTLGVFVSVSRTSLILPKVMKTAWAFYVFYLQVLTGNVQGFDNEFLMSVSSWMWLHLPLPSQ